MTKSQYTSLDVHAKINYRMSLKVYGYSEILRWNSNIKYRSLETFPSNLKYGGWRNTAYDYRTNR